MSKLKEFLQWHLTNPHNLDFKMIVSYEEREATLKEMQDIVNILDTGLTPDEINTLREIDNLIKTKFNGALNLRELVDGFCKFYDANSDGERVAEAILITNEEVAKWKELRERDTAKAPEEFDGYWFKCPSCGNYAGGLRGNFCHVCGQRLKWEGVRE